MHRSLLRASHGVYATPLPYVLASLPPNLRPRDGLSEADFGEAILLTFPPENIRKDRGCYLFVQVVRRTSKEFGVTVQYSTVAKP
jgi:hypothetical protein